MRRDDRHQHPPFAGFARPEANWFRMPDNWIDISAGIKNLAELKVVEYILRHTWGYREYGIKKHITIDEFIHGRKLRAGRRMDRGTGLAEQSVRNGLDAAKQHGLIEEFIDDADKARIKKYYGLKMRPGAVPEPADKAGEAAAHSLGAEVQPLDPEAQELDPSGPAFRPRTETNTQQEPFEEGGSTIASSPGVTRDQQGSGTLSEARHTSARSRRTPMMVESRRSASRAPKPTTKIAVAVAELSERFADRQHQGSNKAQAMNLYLTSNLSEDQFVGRLYEAASITRDAVHRRRHSDGAPIANEMAYLFAVVKDLLAAARDGASAMAKAKPGKEVA